MLKASWGGGGRGMRPIESEDKLLDAVHDGQARGQGRLRQGRGLPREAGARARAMSRCRSSATRHGNLVHLFERDCSIQRRHQKVIERAPAPYLDEGTRAELCEAALKIGRATDYVGAGTVEFLMDADTGPVLLHRGQPAHPGRAHGDRGRHRSRHRQGADPHRRGRAHRRRHRRGRLRDRHPDRRPRSSRAATRCNAA